MNPRLLILSLLALCSCTRGGGDISSQIEAQFKAGPTAPVNLALVGPSSWERFCVLGPYTNNERAEQVLGFKWDAEAKTSIALNDGINVLVFVQGQKVIEYVEHPRNQGDFSQLQPRCLSRAHAVVVRKETGTGWVVLVSNNGA
jgi:hypothetical protein